MSKEKELTAEEYRDTCYIKNDYQKIMYGIQLNYYKELVAKEAVKEFAEELKSNAQIDDLDEITIPMYQLKRLAKQKGVKL